MTYGASGAPGVWDASKTRGCLCSADRSRNSSWSAGPATGPQPGFAFDSPYGGHDCSLRACPLGTDPLGAPVVREVQRVQCTATTGTVTISFREATTSALQWDAPLTAVKAALEGLATVTSVTLSPSSGALCGSGNTGTEVRFETELGNLPMMSAVSSVLGPLIVVEAVAGTMGAEVCSARGVCGEYRGWRVCFGGDELYRSVAQTTRQECATVGTVLPVRTASAAWGLAGTADTA